MIDLARTIDLPLAPDRAWAALWDVPAVARCLPGCETVEEIEPKRRYKATVKDRVGPFSVTIPLDVTVEPSEADRRLRITATGRDSILGSPVRMSLVVRLAPADGGSQLTLDGKAEVGGKLAALGQAVMHRKTRDVLDAFARQLGDMLTAHAS
ncbi:MAG: SRPBCC family protein [Candidatus Rokubacteria bacterium]|nr:SRPBCC family protein [Candidatus Rokubacteria bacterium]